MTSRHLPGENAPAARVRLEEDGGAVVLGLHGTDELAAPLRARGRTPEHVSTRPPPRGESAADKVKVSARTRSRG